jgi:hypothetical protein
MDDVESVSQVGGKSGLVWHEKGVPYSPKWLPVSGCFF